MKNFKTAFLLISILFLLVSCKKKNHTIPEISYGTMTENWKYSNETMKFSLQLPSDWNFMANSEIIPMNIPIPKSLFPTTKFKVLQPIDFQDESSFYPLFSITKNSPEEIKSGDHKVRISFVVASSPENNADEDIKKIKSQFSEKIPPNSKFEINKTTLSFGSEKIPAVDLQMPDMNGNISGNRIYAIKNFESYNLIIIVDYFNTDELQKAKAILASVK